ncbi:3-oxoadipate enol-lactonase [Ancylobacter polymorphus]|uniref:3-oxoadipate enol-lactonase n=1 Tax=Ancylobacter polymorphus TaxID=223390 RepID=A0ABU0BGJ9_9HYPH|nr:3-oxoadipate enol-lactonase [Ancylobacter polymorphus]MDQ0304968.1 3-oxoadipate enol-lactonase [Ancylobacter polymorphus]
MAFARIGDQLLHYRLDGPAEARVLVFANSLGTDLRIWDAVAAGLDGRYRLLTYDKRGHGLSGAPPGPYPLDAHTGDLIGLLDQLGIERFGLVGISVGGMIAQALAARAPERVEALVLADTAARIGTPEMWNARIAAVEAGGLGAIADAVMQRWFSPSFIAERPVELDGWRNLLLRTPVEGYAGTCAAIRDADLSAAVATIARRTLVVAGADDQSTPPALVAATAALLPDGAFVTIPGAGHLPPIEQPAAFTHLLQRYFAEVGFA